MSVWKIWQLHLMRRQDQQKRPSMRSGSKDQIEIRRRRKPCFEKEGSIRGAAETISSQGKSTNREIQTIMWDRTEASRSEKGSSWRRCCTECTWTWRRRKQGSVVYRLPRDSRLCRGSQIELHAWTYSITGSSWSGHSCKWHRASQWTCQQPHCCFSAISRTKPTVWIYTFFYWIKTCWCLDWELHRPSRVLLRMESNIQERHEGALILHRRRNRFDDQVSGPWVFKAC